MLGQSDAQSLIFGILLHTFVTGNRSVCGRSPKRYTKSFSIPNSEVGVDLSLSEIESGWLGGQNRATVR